MNYHITISLQYVLLSALMSEKANYCPQTGRKGISVFACTGLEMTFGLIIFWVKIMMYCCFCNVSHLFHKINHIMDCHNSSSSMTAKKNW